MANKIIQMWEESSHTTALYPASVAEAIKWDSSTTVAQKIASVENKARLVGIDTSTILVTINGQKSEYTYTATQDCYASIGATLWNNITLNGVRINGLTDGGANHPMSIVLPLKVGDTFTLSGNSGNPIYVNIYGLK